MPKFHALVINDKSGAIHSFWRDDPWAALDAARRLNNCTFIIERYGNGKRVFNVPLTDILRK